MKYRAYWRIALQRADARLAGRDHGSAKKEIFALKWKDVDFQTKQIQVNRLLGTFRVMPTTFWTMEMPANFLADPHLSRNWKDMALHDLLCQVRPSALMRWTGLKCSQADWVRREGAARFLPGHEAHQKSGRMLP
jgi:hypothetical protein